jgi:hypothetical protein
MPEPIRDLSRDLTCHPHAAQTASRVLIDSGVPCFNGNIMRTGLHKAIAASFLLCCLTLAAQEKGMWRAANSTAKTITGDIILSDEKLTINFTSFTMVRVRGLEKAELSAAFDADSNANGSGSLYRLNVPAAKKFLHKNSLCGGEDTNWMATYVTGRSLQIAFFSGQKPPLFTLDAISNSTDLCGVFEYVT